MSAAPRAVVNQILDLFLASEPSGRGQDWIAILREVYERQQAAGLWFESHRNPPLQGPLEHFQYDTFIARWSDRQLMADAYVSFRLSAHGDVERIRMKAVSPATDFSYDFHDLDLRRVAGDQPTRVFEIPPAAAIIVRPAGTLALGLQAHVQAGSQWV